MKKTVYFFFLLTLAIAPLRADIYEITHLDETEKFITDDSIVVLDIDDTLLIPAQMLGCDEWFKRRYALHLEQTKSYEEALELSLPEWEGVRMLTKMVTCEPETAKIVERLQSHGRPVMGLTTQGLALATRTWRQLLKHQIDLQPTAPHQGDHYQTVGKHSTLFRHGILFTSGTHKGKAFFNLCDTIGYEPKHIIFVNDKKKHLKQLEESAEERKIAYTGLRYAYSDKKKAAFDSKIADYQFHNSPLSQLLTDEEAAAMLENSSLESCQK